VKKSKRGDGCAVDGDAGDKEEKERKRGANNNKWRKELGELT
jgi:hypothetical protein